MRRVNFVERFLSMRPGLFAAAIAAAFVIGCGHFGSTLSAPQGAAPARGFGVHRSDTIAFHVHTWINADHAQPAPVWSSVQQYLDYAIVGQSVHDLPLASSIAAAGIGVVEYTNPNRQSQIGTPHFPNNLPSDYAHDCLGERIYKVGYGEATPPPPTPQPTPTDYAMYLMDPHSANLAVSWATEVTTFWTQSGVAPAYVFEDDADSINSTAPAKPCHYGQPDWTNATNGLDSTMMTEATAAGENVAVLYNGLGSPAHPLPTKMPDAIGVNQTAAGGMAENCYSRQPAATAANPDPKPFPEKDSEWLQTENVEIAMAAAQKMFVCNANSDQAIDADKKTGLRLYVIASFLLTYDPNTTVLDEQFRPASGFSVFPESQIVATNPLSPQPLQIADLYVGGVYARQYGECYIDGALLGSCAAVVNPSSTTTYPFPLIGVYGGTLELVGGGVLDTKAKVKLTATIPATLGPRSAVIAYATPAPSPSLSPSPSPSLSPSPSPTP